MNEEQKYFHGQLIKYDSELTKSRWTIFVALMTISLAICAIIFKDLSAIVNFPTDNISIVVGILFGFTVHIMSIVHYFWYHRISHEIRKKIAELEEGFTYGLSCCRERPNIYGLVIHYHWFIMILFLSYSLLTLFIVGWRIFVIYFCGYLSILLLLAISYNIHKIFKDGNRSSK